MSNVKTDENKTRDTLIRALNKSGKSTKEISNEFGISKTRVTQIVYEEKRRERAMQNPIYFYCDGNNRLYNSFLRAGIRNEEDLLKRGTSRIRKPSGVGYDNYLSIIERVKQNILKTNTEEK